MHSMCLLCLDLQTPFFGLENIKRKIMFVLYRTPLSTSVSCNLIGQVDWLAVLEHLGEHVHWLNFKVILMMATQESHFKMSDDTLNYVVTTKVTSLLAKQQGALSFWRSHGKSLSDRWACCHFEFAGFSMPACVMRSATFFSRSSMRVPISSILDSSCSDTAWNRP